MSRVDIIIYKELIDLYAFSFNWIFIKNNFDIENNDCVTYIYIYIYSHS